MYISSHFSTVPRQILFWTISKSTCVYELDSSLARHPNIRDMTNLWLNGKCEWIRVARLISFYSRSMKMSNFGQMVNCWNNQIRSHKKSLTVSAHRSQVLAIHIILIKCSLCPCQMSCAHSWISPCSLIFSHLWSLLFLPLETSNLKGIVDVSLL